MKQSDEKQLLKISELAEAAGVSVSTAKYYVKEGLVDISCKTGRNMAWYAPESVERVKLIKSLQSEKYYPLAVIKRIVRDGADADEVRLLDVINKADESDYYETLPFSQAVQEAGLKVREAEMLVNARLIQPMRDGHTRLCNRGDLRMMKLSKCRLDAGIPLSQTVKVFAMFEERLKESTRWDIESLVADCLLKKTLSTEDIVKIINVSDETLDDFIGMRRYALNAAMGADFISKTEDSFSSLESFAKGLIEILDREGRSCSAAVVRNVLKGEKTGDPVLDCYGELLSLKGEGIAKVLSVLHNASLCFSQQIEPRGDENESFVRAALRFGWQSFAPAELGIMPASSAFEFSVNIGDEELVKNALRLCEELQGEK